MKVDIYLNLVFKRFETQQALGANTSFQVGSEIPTPMTGDVVSFNGEDDPSFTITRRHFVYDADSLKLYLTAKED